MKLPHILITLLLLGFVSIAEAGIPFLSKTVSWNEEVLLADGQQISVQRTVTYGLLVNDTHLFGERGGGAPEKQTIRFFYKGRSVDWEFSNPSNDYVMMPDIFDFVNNMPVLVLPVYNWKPCATYDFPREGLVAFGYQNGQWDRIDINKLPKTLKVNLLRNTHDLRYGNKEKYKDKLITTPIKQDLEKNGSRPTQGQLIPELIKIYSGVEESCARINPLPNPALEAAKKHIAETEVHAVSFVATLRSSSNLSEKISPDDFRNAHGKWTGNGYLADNCKGIVKGINPVRQYRDGGGWSLVGRIIILKNEKQIPLGSVEFVTCDNYSIYAIEKQARDQLIVHRFSHDGTPESTLNIKLPDVDKYFAKEKWPVLWEVLPENNQLTIVLASYSYKMTADLGGILEQRLTYSVQLLK